MEYKFISKNTFENITLHDCIIDSVSLGHKEISIIFEHIDVLKTHPLNTFSEPKYTGNAKLIFKDCIIIKSFYYDTSHNIKQHHLLIPRDAIIKNINFVDLATGMEILSVETEVTDDKFNIYKFMGIGTIGDFAEFHLKFKDLYICWDEFKGDAWFANR